MSRKISVLGATGSIGDSTLDIIGRAQAGVFKVVSLTANSNSEKLAAQALKFKAEFVALADSKNADDLRARLARYSYRAGQ